MITFTIVSDLYCARSTPEAMKGHRIPKEYENITCMEPLDSSFPSCKFTARWLSLLSRKNQAPNLLSSCFLPGPLRSRIPGLGSGTSPSDPRPPSPRPPCSRSPVPPQMECPDCPPQDHLEPRCKRK